MDNFSVTRRSNSRAALLAGFIAASAIGPFSHAVTVTNLSSNASVFAESFENGLSTLTPSVGTWTRIGPSVGATNSTTAPSPGPAEGSLYASIFRSDLTTHSQGDLLGTLGAVQSMPGDMVRLSVMLFVPDDGVLDRARLFLADGDYVNFRALVRTDGAGNVLASGPGAVPTDTGIDYVPDTWQRWDLTYEIGSTTFSVRVGNAMASGLDARSVGQVSTLGISNGSGVPGAFYVDAVPVPEPATSALMLAGLAGLGALARRRSPASVQTPIEG